MIHHEKNPKHILRERTKAKRLRKTQWWKNKITNGICNYCQGKFIPDELTMDHVIPLSRGGRSIKGNIVPSCKPCNNMKNYLTPAEMVLNRLKEQEQS
ncbi:MAG: HNH endonuclease [wastewater metagenome]|nr:HNH endonuclease [Candidatus Loosdrechtia aerotolerans]